MQLVCGRFISPKSHRTFANSVNFNVKQTFKRYCVVADTKKIFIKRRTGTLWICLWGIDKSNYQYNCGNTYCRFYACAYSCICLSCVLYSAKILLWRISCEDEYRMYMHICFGNLFYVSAGKNNCSKNWEFLVDYRIFCCWIDKKQKKHEAN